MSLGTRDVEALDLLRARSFANAYVASLELDLQARRLTVAFYGTLRAGDRGTYLGTTTFYGASALAIENESANFPDSARLRDVSFAYDEETERGSVEAFGAEAWTLAWSFDGIAYEEHPAIVASLADEA